MEYFWGGTEEEGVAVVKPWNEQTVNEMAVESVVRAGDGYYCRGENKQCG